MTPVRSGEYKTPLETARETKVVAEPPTQTFALVIGYTKGISVNSEALEVGESIAVMPGMVSIEFDRIASSTEVNEIIEVIPRKNHPKAKTIACIALLPLCPAIMSLNTEGSAKTITQTKSKKAWCVGSIDLEVYSGARYIAKIVVDESTYSNLQIKEEEPNPYRVSNGLLKCRTIEKVVTNSYRQHFHPMPDGLLFDTIAAQPPGSLENKDYRYVSII